MRQSMISAAAQTSNAVQYILMQLLEVGIGHTFLCNNPFKSSQREKIFRRPLRGVNIVDRYTRGCAPRCGAHPGLFSSGRSAATLLAA
jgi:hypothetical protein